MTNIIKIVKEFISIKANTDTEGTITSITQDIPLRGTNIWLLVSSAMLASIGLDVDSPAVIIGAMLISPLMAPILGMGLSIGIEDKEILFKSIREFSLAVILSLVVSTLYFVLTPLGNPTHEILTRVKPTLLDVLIAFFGGTAGIVASSRSRATAAIPGVAIATALMPPICVAGFGLATRNFDIFLGAFYLFFINSAFISFSAYLIVRYLNFPIKEYLDRSIAIRMHSIVFAVIIVIMVPSIFIFYNIIVGVRLNNSIKLFIKDKITTQNNNVIKWNFYENKNGKNDLNIYTVGEKISDTKVDTLEKLLPDYNIKNTRLNLLQLGLTSNIENIRNELKSDVNRELDIVQKLQAQNESQRKTLEEKLKTYTIDTLKFQEASAELKTLFPELNKIGYSKMEQNYISDDTTTTKLVPTVSLEWSIKVKSKIRKRNEKKIYEFLLSRLGVDTLQILNY